MCTFSKDKKSAENNLFPENLVDEEFNEEFSQEQTDDELNDELDESENIKVEEDMKPSEEDLMQNIIKESVKRKESVKKEKRSKRQTFVFSGLDSLLLH